VISQWNRALPEQKLIATTRVGGAAGGTIWLLYYRSRELISVTHAGSAPRRTRAPSGHSAGGGVIGGTR